MPKYAIVTGASSGIGKASAKLLCSQGYHVVAVGRSQDKLKTLADEVENKQYLHTLAADITSYADLLKIVAMIPKNARLACVLHAAAVMEPLGRICDNDDEAVFYHSKTNGSSALVLTMMLMSKMTASDRVLFIGSYFSEKTPEQIQKIQGVCEAYYHSKTNLSSQVESLRNEIPSSGYPPLFFAKPGRVRDTETYNTFWENKTDKNPTISPDESAQFLASLLVGPNRPSNNESNITWDIKNEEHRQRAYLGSNTPRINIS